MPDGFTIITQISIHAPTRGATRQEKNTAENSRFQSTLPQGERPTGKDAYNYTTGISIHAPTRGATYVGQNVYSNLNDFNPRSHKGSDKPGLQNLYHQYNFNPRSHKGSDYNYTTRELIKQISIHAPTRGATKSRSDILMLSIIFQSTLPQGERRNDTDRVEFIFNFNPRSHKGSDIWETGYGWMHSDFNPRSHKGSDYRKREASRMDKISIHAPTRGATKTQQPNPNAYKDISIHAPTRGATVLIKLQKLLPQYFNPRSHKGSDYKTSRITGGMMKISIHAPTRNNQQA